MKRKMVITLIALALVCSVSVGTLTACGSKKTDDVVTEETETQANEISLDAILDEMNSYVIVDVEEIAEKFGFDLKKQSDEIILQKDEMKVVLSVGSKTFTVNSEEFELGAEVMKKDEKVGVELEGFAKAVGYQVTITRIKEEIQSIAYKTNDGTESKYEDVKKTDEQTLVVKDDIAVRENPEASAKKLGILKKGESIVQTGYTTNWIQVKYNGKEGYVKKEYLSENAVDALGEDNQTEVTNVDDSSKAGGEENTSENGDTSNTTVSASNSAANSTSNSSSGNTNTSSENNSTSNSSSGNSDMYSFGDNTAKERLNACRNILSQGICGPYMSVGSTYVEYHESLFLSTSSVNGAWFYMYISEWDDTIWGIDEETDKVYEEMPSLVRQCINAIAPEGGNGVYQTIDSLIDTYGSPRNVPSQGQISESIPGLYVTVEQGKNGINLYFFPE